MTIKNVLVINGPNLDMLGVREPGIYGDQTLRALEDAVVAYGAQLGIKVTCYQSNSEAKLINKIHESPKNFDAIVYNPAAHTHYSYALRDAVGSIDLPVVEVHLSNINQREPFRQISVIAPACVAQVKGLGVDSYRRGLDLLVEGANFCRLGEGFDTRIVEDATIVVATNEGLLSNGTVPPRNAAMEAAAMQDEAVTPIAVPKGGRVFSAPMAMPAYENPRANAAANQPLRQGEGGGAVQGQVPAQGLPQSHGQAQALSQGQPLPQRGQARGPMVDLTAPFAEAIHKTQSGLVSVERQTLLRLACSWLGIGAILVRDTDNIRWVTDIDGVFDEERAHGLLVAANMAVLHSDSRYANALRRVIKRQEGNIIVDDQRMTHAAFAWNVLTQNGANPFGAKLGIEDTITYAEFVKMVEKFTTEGLAPTTDVVLKLRAVKDAGEIQRMRAAQVVTDAAFKHIVGFMKPGMTEREVQLELEDFMLRHGACGVAFRSIVAAGANGADPHAIPGQTRLEAGQAVVLDFGAKAFDYCSDMTRTVFLGQPNEEMTRAWETLRRANETVEAMLRPGVTGKDAHETAEKVLAEGGFGALMGHGLGHGVGLSVHELPVLSPQNTEALVEGNVVTVEPGIYVPGRFGMRLEDFGVITAEGFDIFTRSTHDMVII